MGQYRIADTNTISVPPRPNCWACPATHLSPTFFVRYMRWPSRSYTCTSYNTFRTSFGRTAKSNTWYGRPVIWAERRTLIPTYIIRCLHFRPLIGRASFCSTPSLAVFSSTPSLALFSSTPSLAGTQRQQVHLHQQECGSSAAAPTARMCRVQLWVACSSPCSYVSSDISCDCLRVPFFQLESLPGFTSPTFRRGLLMLDLVY